MSDLTIPVAVFEHAKDNHPVRHDLSWESLAGRLCRYEERPNKDGRAWSPVTYRPGSTRGKENVEQVHALVLDIDHNDLPIELLGGLEYVAHTTFSHTEDDPRWRVVLPLTHPVEGEDWPEFWLRANAYFGGCVDPQTKDRSRIFYLPSCRPGAVHNARVHHGLLLDPASLPQVPQYHPEPPARTHGALALLPDDRLWRWAAEFRDAKIEALAGMGRDTGRNAECNRTAFLLAGLIADGRHGLEVNSIESGLFLACQSNGLVFEDGERSVRATIQSGITAGLGKPWSPADRDDGWTEPTPLMGSTAAPAPTDVWARPISALLEQAETEPDWLIEPLFSAGSSGFIAAEPKVGKSFISLELAYCLTTGEPFVGRFAVKHPRRVLFIEEEDAERRMVRRSKQLIRGTPGRQAPPDELYRFVCRSGFRLDDAGWMGKLKSELESFRPDVVFLDVFNKLHLKDENSQPEMSSILHDLAALTRQYGCAFIILHHYRKSGIGQSTRGNQMLRGTSALAGFAECSLFLKKGRGNAVTCEAESKDAAEIEPFEIRIRDVNNGVKLECNETPTRVREGQEEDEVLTAIHTLTNDGQDVVPTSVAATLGWERTRTSRALGRLVSAGKLDVETVSRGRSRWRIYTLVTERPL